MATGTRKTGVAKPAAGGREDRLKAALKANLARRKAQAKKRAAADTAEPDAGKGS